MKISAYLNRSSGLLSYFSWNVSKYFKYIYVLHYYEKYNSWVLFMHFFFQKSHVVSANEIPMHIQSSGFK